MKTRERVKRIRNSKSYPDQLALARGGVAGTRHDDFIRKTRSALARWQSDCHEIIANNTQWLKVVGETTARAIWRGDSDFFRSLAKAIDTHLNHVSEPDRLREEILRESRLFPITPKMRETFDRTGKMPGIRRALSVRKTILRLVEQKVVSAEILLKRNQHKRIALGRRIRKLCGEMGIKTDHKAGKPK